MPLGADRWLSPTRKRPLDHEVPLVLVIIENKVKSCFIMSFSTRLKRNGHDMLLVVHDPLRVTIESCRERAIPRQ